MRWMTSWITRLALLACLAPAQAADALVVGAAMAQSGALAELAMDYRKGLQLWQDQVNASGGLLGRRVELRILDDGSAAARSASLYEELLGESQLLVGPFGSAATLIAASVAERSRRVLINAAGASSAVHRRSPRFVFQTTVPYAAYGEQAVSLARDQGITSIFLAARDDPASREMVEAAQASARALGIAANVPEIYSGSVSDFAHYIERARAAQAEAWIVFGDARDAVHMARSLRLAGYAPRMFFARGAADAKFLALAGQQAELTISATAYDPRLVAGGSGFAKAFMAKHASMPGAGAADGYVAGQVLGAGVLRAGTLNQEPLRAALATLEAETLFGLYKVDPATGAQIGARPMLFQIIEGKPRLVRPGEKVKPWH